MGLPCPASDVRFLHKYRLGVDGVDGSNEFDSTVSRAFLGKRRSYREWSPGVDYANFVINFCQIVF
jgi:hypothetical protein